MSNDRIYGIVYLLTNSVNGKRYVGQTTKTLDHRFRGHCKSAYRKRQMPISRAVAKHGPENFSREVLFEAFDVAALNSAEISLIAEMGCLFPQGYNLKIGGDFAPHHAETLARIAAKIRGRTLSAEHRAKISAGLRGSERFAAGQARRRSSHISDEHRKKIAASLRGKPKTAEHNAAVAVALCGRKAPWAVHKSADHVAKVAAANRGQKRSPESRKRMSDAGKLRVERQRTALSATV